jgi:hypothetical protein
MHAVVVKVTITDEEAAEKGLQEEVVPSVSQAPGLVAAYWTRSADGGNGASMLVFESEEAAKAMAGVIDSPNTDAVTIDDVEVREVVASA